MEYKSGWVEYVFDLTTTASTYIGILAGSDPHADFRWVTKRLEVDRNTLIATAFSYDKREGKNISNDMTCKTVEQPRTKI